jgi:putative tryptophan/tyrosine transport system substrate-binding protein
MKRREFITLLGGAAAWPLAARAQPPPPVIGFLNSQSPGSFSHLVAGFHQGLAENGYVEGRSIAIEYRWAEGQYERLPALASELVRRGVAVLVAAGGEPSALAAKAATATIPIVFVIGSDPIEAGLVASMNRPGANVTGVTLLNVALDGKRLGLLQEMIPGASLIAALINPDFPSAETQRRDFLEAVSRSGLRSTVVYARAETDFQPAFATLREQHVDALLVCADPLFNSRRDQLVALAAHHQIPAMYSFRVTGGLMSYGVNIVEQYREVGRYTARIFKGTKPADLPVLQPTKFDLVLNLKTARALGLDVPAMLLARADEVIE